MNSGDFRDRTDEFNSIAECVKRQTTSQNTGDSKKGTNGTVTTTQGRSQFSIIATSIGRDIHRTSEKIARLTERKEHLFFLFTHTLLKKKKKKSKHFFLSFSHQKNISFRRADCRTTDTTTDRRGERRPERHEEKTRGAHSRG